MSRNIERAEAISQERNAIWQDAWDEWDLITYVDMIIAKCKRALYCLEERPIAIEHAEDSVIDGLNYAKELKKRLKEQMK